MKTCVEKRVTLGAPGPDVMEQVIAQNKEYLEKIKIMTCILGKIGIVFTEKTNVCRGGTQDEESFIMSEKLKSVF